MASEAKGCDWLCQLLVFFRTGGYRERGREVGAMYVCVHWGMGQVGNWLSIDSTCLIFISSLLTTVSVLGEPPLSCSAHVVWMCIRGKAPNLSLLNFLRHRQMTKPGSAYSSPWF